MALPLSRNRTYVAGSQVKAADLNDFQDQIISLNEGNHSTRRYVMSPMEFQSVGSSTTAWTWPSVGPSVAPYRATTNGTPAAGILRGRAPLQAGDILEKVDFWVKTGGATSGLVLTVSRFDIVDGAVYGGYAMTAVADGVRRKETNDMFGDLQLPTDADESKYIDIQVWNDGVGTAERRFYGCEIFYRREL